MTENSIRNVDGMNNLELPRLKITSQTHLISASPMRTFEIANNDDNITFVNVIPTLTKESFIVMIFFLTNFSQYFMIRVFPCTKSAHYKDISIHL